MAMLPAEEPVDVLIEDEAYRDYERDEEQMNLAFDFDVDEPPIRHDVFPDSDSDNDGEEPRQENVIQHGQRGSEENLHVGQTFYHRDDIKESVLDHALKHGRNIKQIRYDTNKLAYKCLGGDCQWRLWSAIRANGDKWEIKSFNDQHSCVPNGLCDLLKVPVIARLYLEKIREEPSYYMPKKIEELIKEKWGITVSRPQCQKARFKALKWIEDWNDHQFSRLRDYAREILVSNPGSSVDVDCWKNVEGQDMFRSFYVCYDAVKKSWKNHCRPILGIDGCFLRGKMKGMVLVALGRDADNRIYPIAWAIVQKEDTPNWFWFLEKLKVDLGLGLGEGHVLISDRQKGLLNAVDESLPKIEHRMCVRHVYHNVKTRHAKKAGLKLLIWKLAWSFNEPEFKANLKKIHKYDVRIYKDVVDSKPENWCRAFYAIGSCCEDVHNNSTESWNATIVRAREKGIVPMLELIHRQSMSRIFNRSVRAQGHTGRISPYAQDILEKQHADASECTVQRSTNDTYSVQLRKCLFRVSLSRRSCTCRRWDIRGVPCEHAYGVMLDRNLDVEEYVAYWFMTSTWRSTYEEGIIPSRGERFWPVGPEPPIHRPPSPKLPGRKKKIAAKKNHRKRSVGESPPKKKDDLKKRTLHCRICGRANHNARFHKQRILSQGQSSQSQDQPTLESQPST